MPNQKGSVHLLSLLGILVVGALFISSNVPVERVYPSGNVKGVKVIDAQTKDPVKVATMEGKNVVVEKNSGAVSSFPLSVDPKTNILTVTTPAGVKTVAVLPDVAVNNLLSSRVITEVDSSEVSGSLASFSKIMDLEEKDGKLVYKIKGQRKNRLLGLIPVKTSVTAYVSAESGEVLESSQSFLGRLLNKISSTAD
ncbi:MAG: hypothetical protein Q7S88_00365 [Candidatus Daviesbacteria bacterium]|nr:hypothetical protein [Candidatus Daviesbacteria bacterium]